MEFIIIYESKQECMHELQTCDVIVMFKICNIHNLYQINWITASRMQLCENSYMSCVDIIITVIATEPIVDIFMHSQIYKTIWTKEI